MTLSQRLKRTVALAVLAFSMPFAASAEGEAVRQYKLCMLDQLSLLGAANLDHVRTRADFVNMFENVIAQRCWIENKMAAWESAVEVAGVANARSLRLSNIAVDLEAAIISDLADQLAQ